VAPVIRKAQPVLVIRRRKCAVVGRRRFDSLTDAGGIAAVVCEGITAATAAIDRTPIGKEPFDGVEILRLSNWLGDIKSCRLLFNSLVPVFGIWMVAQKLGLAAATLSLDRLEHVSQISGIVARASHDLRAQHIGLSLVFPAELQEVHPGSHL